MANKIDTNNLKNIGSTGSSAFSGAKAKLGTMGILGLVLLGLLGWAAAGYNGLLKSDQEVKKQFSNIQSQYQRRADLIPNLVSTVEGAANNEKDILTKVTNARAGITDAKSSISNATTPQQLQEAGAKVSSALALTVEAYPQITSTALYANLQTDLTGTENRIQAARQDYNKAVTDYNIKAKRFPTVILAKLFGYNAKDQFQADSGAQSVPKVKFNNNNSDPSSDLRLPSTDPNALPDTDTTGQELQ